MNAKKCLVIAVVIVLSAAGSQALAQMVSTAPGNNCPVPYGAPYGGTGYGQMYAETSSTVAEAYLRGMSKVIRAEGDYNLSTSQAAINAEEALRQNILNRQALVKAYFELRKMNRDYRAAERHPGLRANSQVRVAQPERPRLLNPLELEVQTGKIRWPKLLAADTHAENRELLDEYFATRAEKRAMSTRAMSELRSAVLAMLADLKEQRRVAPPADYQAATEFLRSLAYEGQRAVGDAPRLVATSK